MDLIVPIFAVVTTAVLCALCLIVLEYQNGRNRRMSQIWTSRVQSLPARPNAAAVVSPISEDTQAA